MKKYRFEPDLQTDELTAIASELEESGGELTPEIEERIRKAIPARAAAAQQVVLWIKEHEKLAEANKALAADYSARKRRCEKIVESLTEYLIGEMRAANQKSIVCEAFKITRAKIGIPRLDAADPDETVPEFCRRVIPEEWQLDKKLLLAALKAQRDMPDEAGEYEAEINGYRIKIEVRESLRVTP